MSISVVLNWKSFLAIGAGTAIIIGTCKMDGNSSERVLTHASDACKEVVAARVASTSDVTR